MLAKLNKMKKWKLVLLFLGVIFLILQCIRPDFNNGELKGENDADLDKFSLGKFRDYKMAQDFQKDIINMGIKDAFVIAKIDGKRVTVAEGLEAARK